MTITITAFERSPDGGKGLARDTRVRWALEEVGQPYEVRPVSFRAMNEPAHLALHPFGQIPTYVLLRLKASGHSGRISEPLRLCGPRRSAARLQACFRRSTGGQQAADRLIEVRLEVVIRFFRSVYGA